MLNLMLLHGLKESLNLTYFGAIQRVFLKTNAVVSIKRKRVTIEVAMCQLYWADGWHH